MEKIIVKSSIVRTLLACVEPAKTERKPLTGLNFTEDGYIEATNGKIAMRIKTEYIYTGQKPVGPYTVIAQDAKTYKKVDQVELVIEKMDYQNYPNILAVVPKGDIQNGSIVIPEDADSLALSGRILEIYCQTGKAINYQYIKALAPLGVKWCIMSPKTVENTVKPLHLEYRDGDDHFVAVIVGFDFTPGEQKEA